MVAGNGSMSPSSAGSMSLNNTNTLRGSRRNTAIGNIGRLCTAINTVRICLVDELSARAKVPSYLG